jgi:hypothetical protein
MGERRGAYSILVGKHAGKEPIGRPRRRWENNIKTDFQTMERGVD